MKMIKTRSGLPPEFHLDNYKDLDKLNASAWITELNKRLHRYKSIDRDAPIRNPYPWGFGIISTTMDARQLNTMRDKLRTTDQKLLSKINTKSIKMLTVGDAVTLNTHLEISPEFKNSEKTPFLATTKQENPLDGQAIGLHQNQHIFPSGTVTPLYGQAIGLHQNQHVFPSGRVPITIDFQKSNDELMEEFKLFIAAYRTQLNAYKPHPLAVPNAKNRGKWLEWKVLQYIDLDLWAQYNNVEISQPLMFKTLFPNSVVGSDKIKDTVKPGVMKLLSALEANSSRFVLPLPVLEPI